MNVARDYNLEYQDNDIARSYLNISLQRLTAGATNDIRRRLDVPLIKP